MNAIRLPISLHRSYGAEIRPGVLGEATVTATSQRYDRFDVRDHRDDGSVIGGLLIGLSLGVLAWALLITLLVVLFW